MWIALTCCGHFWAQASNKAVESAPPLNATASGNAGEKRETASSSVAVTRDPARPVRAPPYLDAVLVSVKRP